MRLLMHNQLVCPKPGCEQKSFPLVLKPTQVEQEQGEFKAEYVARLMPKVDYPALLEAAVVLGIKGLPEQLPGKLDLNLHEQILRLLQKLLLDIHVLEGSLECKLCKRSYAIKRGIPNMRLNEDEIH